MSGISFRLNPYTGQHQQLVYDLTRELAPEHLGAQLSKPRQPSLLKLEADFMSNEWEVGTFYTDHMYVRMRFIGPSKEKYQAFVDEMVRRLQKENALWPYLPVEECGFIEKSNKLNSVFMKSALYVDS